LKHIATEYDKVPQLLSWIAGDTIGPRKDENTNFGDLHHSVCFKTL